MNVIEAKFELGIEGSFNPEIVKNAYKSLASKHHPDKGGNTDKMKTINEAYALLKARTQVEPEIIDWEKIRKESNAKKSMQLEVIVSKLDTESFVNYFNMMMNDNFESHVQIINEKYYINGNVKVRFFNSDKSTIFVMDVCVSNFSNNKKATFLSTDEEISFDLCITAYAYHNRKKVKMARKDYKFDNNHRVLFDPSKTFTKAKLTKMAQTVKADDLKKADMELALKFEVGAIEVNGVYFVPTANADLFVKIYRSVIYGKASWTILNISKRTSNTYKLYKQGFIKSFFETSNFVDTLLKFKNMSVEDLSGDEIKKILMVNV